MSEMPLVSVIIPCYNSESWIEETLLSVYNQSYQNIEVIIIDDGSTDRTKEIIVSQKKENIYFSQKNKGPSAARNLGIKMARGKYIAFLDSDDIWEKEKLSIQVGYLETNEDVDLVFSNVSLINEEGRFLYNNYNKVPKQKHEIIIKLFKGQITMNTPTIVARTESVLNVGGFDEELPLREDHFFLMNIVDRYNVYHFKEQLVKRRISQDSLSSSLDATKIFELNEPFIQKSHSKFDYLSKYASDVYCKMNSAIGRGHWKKYEYQMGLKHMLQAIRYKPLNIKNYIFLMFILTKTDHQFVEKIKMQFRTKLKNGFSILSK